MKILLYGLATSLSLMAGTAAQATPITSFEAGSRAGNGLTLTQGGVSRATIESSAFSSDTTLTPTDGARLVKMIAGTSTDIINPLFPNQLVTPIDFDNRVVTDKAYLLMDFALMVRDPAPPHRSPSRQPTHSCSPVWAF